MAAPTNTVVTAQPVAFREDISNVIHNLDVHETPFFSATAKKKATNTTHSWLTDEIAQAADNAHVQGDDTVAEALVPRVKLSNETQIFKKSITVSGSVQAGDYVGPTNLMADELRKKMKEIKKDVELAIFANQAKVSGDSGAVPGRLAGIPTWVTSAVVAGVGGVDPTGDGTDARTNGTTTAFIEDNLMDVLQQMWNDGADADTVFLRPTLQRQAAAFQGNAPRREMKNMGKATQSLDVYVTDFGEVMFKMSREIRAIDVVVVEMGRQYVGEYRAFKNEELSKTGDSDKRQIIGEYTFAPGNPESIGLITDRA